MERAKIHQTDEPHKTEKTNREKYDYGDILIQQDVNPERSKEIEREKKESEDEGD